MGFNRRKLEDQRRQAAEKEAAGRRATDAQLLEDAERLITAWNERQTKHMPMLFSPTIGAAHHRRLLVPLGTLSGTCPGRQLRRPIRRPPRSFGLPIGGHCSRCIGRCGKRGCRQNEVARSLGSLAGHTGYSLARRSAH
jgi:hypothetical protein